MKKIYFSLALLLFVAPLTAQPDFQLLSIHELHHQSPEQIPASND